MKKIFLLSIILIFLAGCGVFNLSNFVLPNDIDFINIIETSNTPEKICNYIKENFTYKENIFYSPDPYTLWLIQEGDCNDFCTYAQFVANHHGYETWQIFIYFKGTFIKHILGVYLEDDGYTYLDIKAYRPLYASSFKEIVLDYFKLPIGYELKSYRIYDYDMNLIEKGYND